MNLNKINLVVHTHSHAISRCGFSFVVVGNSGGKLPAPVEAGKNRGADYCLEKSSFPEGFRAVKAGLRECRLLQ